MDKMIPLKQLCRDVDMDPRQARILLRKLTPHQPKKRWEWGPEEYIKIKELVNDARTKNKDDDIRAEQSLSDTSFS